MRRLHLILPLVAVLLAACASSHVLTGTPRPPIDPAQVRFYYAPPSGRFEEVALLEANSGAFTYGSQNKTNSVMDKLRREAAKLGANGVLFQGTAEGPGSSGVGVGVGGGSFGRHSYSGGGVGVNISPTQKFGRGVAIYVSNPPPEAAPQQRASQEPAPQEPAAPQP